MNRPAVASVLLEQVERTRRRTYVAPAIDVQSPRTALAGEVLTDSIVHEAAQPMQALSSMLREMQVISDTERASRVRSLATDGIKQLNELRQLQEELRAASNLARGERMRATYLRKEFAALDDTLRPVADALPMRLRLRTADLWLRVDNTALRRVVKILVSNAFKHSGAASVTVRAFASDTGLLIAVRDDGAGMTERELAHIFLPPNDLAVEDEWQARRGYGLYIARLILARLGGSLMVRSSPLGTTFFVSLPRTVMRQAGEARDAVALGGSMRGHLIIMLDDDARALSASARLFETLGARVLAFTEELDLLAACNSLPAPPSLFILDYRLGETTCERVLDSLRRWRKESFNCVVLTGDDSVTSGLREMQSDVLVASKPLNDWTLAHIERFLRGEIRRITDGVSATRAQ